MKHRKKHFRTFIINKNTIILYMSIIIFSAVLTGIFSSLHIFNKRQTLSVIYRATVKSGIPLPEKEGDSICMALLGFDISDKSSIIFANPIFSPVSYSMWDMSGIVSGMYNEETPPPSAEPENAENEKNNIEKINIYRGMDISNATDYNVDAGELSKQTLDFKINKNKVEVLIEHTHTTEAYSDNGSGSDRNLDETKNVISIGEKICDVLNEYGIKTVHDKTIHDYPSYNGAYGRSLTTVKNNLSKYPDIKVVLDVHRDAIVRDNGKKVAVCADTDGKSSSQVMLVVGTDAMGLSHGKWRENMKFASHIQAYANEKYPGLMRPINLRQERFNMHTTTGSLIVEVGSSGNTQEEALIGAENFARCLAMVLTAVSENT
ncbi:MAG: stage II sporulation protein P [Oscillospiraceae bacterium]|nr:stage II sporulation protein P [Oscillospiraceae bacterium]